MSYPCPVSSCRRDMPGTATVCGACVAALARALDAVGWLAGELDVTLSRQTARAGGGRSSEAPLPLSLAASDAVGGLRVALVGWVRVLGEDAPPREGPADTLPAMAAWLSAGRDRVAVHPAAVEIIEEITAAVRAAERAVDRPPGYVYAGPCEVCGCALHARPGAVLVQCRTPGCGAEPVSVAARREWMRGECVDLLGSSSFVASVCVALGEPVADSTIRMWVRRGRLVPHSYAAARGTQARKAGRLHPQYRVGDVLALRLESARRTSQAPV